MTTTYPDFYDADVDEMTAGGLAVLLEVRTRLLRLAPESFIIATVDEFAAELLANVTDEDGDEA
jgi:hypothetical protein